MAWFASKPLPGNEWLRIPEHPVSHSNDIRSTVPGYPVTFDTPLLSV